MGVKYGYNNMFQFSTCVSLILSVDIIFWMQKDNLTCHNFDNIILIGVR